MAESLPIPEPPGLPFIGNLGEFQTSPIKDLTRLADTYGMPLLIAPPMAGAIPTQASNN